MDFESSDTSYFSGRGKGGKGLGKGGAKRHRKLLRDNIQGITKPAIRRLARRGGVKRISGLIYEEICRVSKVFLEDVIRDAVLYTTHANQRKTVSALDVVHALKNQGRTLYGYDDGKSRSGGNTNRHESSTGSSYSGSRQLRDREQEEEQNRKRECVNVPVNLDAVYKVHVEKVKDVEGVKNHLSVFSNSEDGWYKQCHLADWYLKIGKGKHVLGRDNRFWESMFGKTYLNKSEYPLRVWTAVRKDNATIADAVLVAKKTYFSHVMVDILCRRPGHVLDKLGTWLLEQYVKTTVQEIVAQKAGNKTLIPKQGGTKLADLAGVTIESALYDENSALGKRYNSDAKQIARMKCYFNTFRRGMESGKGNTNNVNLTFDDTMPEGAIVPDQVVMMWWKTRSGDLEIKLVYNDRELLANAQAEKAKATKRVRFENA